MATAAYCRRMYRWFWRQRHEQEAGAPSLCDGDATARDCRQSPTRNFAQRPDPKRGDCMNISDWTKDGGGIAYQSCDNCKAVWYFQCHFCPQCGTSAPATLQASGLGTVHARTLVARAPTEELRAHAPYLIDRKST